MSHEVRTPLTSIMGFAEILTEEITGQPQRFADLITKSADRLLTTLDSVLRLAKLEAGTEVLTPKTLELRELVENIVQEKQQQAAEKNIALQLTCYAPMVHAHGGHGAMQRVVYNLLSNAIKFTASGGTVSLHLAQGPKAVLLEVMDTGIGMTQNFQARMFKAFTQESEGLAREHEGSGLGLAIVHELVDLMQGAIEVESTRGQGTRIAVFLPRASQETVPRA
jgi:signal transduction histidine kinase